MQQPIRRASLKTCTHVSGHGWTGALGTGSQTMTDSRTSTVTPSQRDEDFTRLLLPPPFPPHTSVLHAAAGWGHTLLVTQDREIYMAGRPYDFQTLLRMYRMPPFLRRLAVFQSLAMERISEGGGDVAASGKRGGSFWGKWMDGLFRNSKGGEKEEVYRQAIFPEYKKVELPHGDVPRVGVPGDHVCHKTLAASAGLSAIVGESGKVYTFGLNHRGQCGVGDRNVFHVWEPRAVIQKTDENEQKIIGVDLENIIQVDLGLQHGLALDRDGKLYGWGKGSRGQLGLAHFVGSDVLENDKESSVDMEYAAIPVDDFEVSTQHSRAFLSGNDAKVRSMSAGWNHSCCVTESNHAFIWGKNALAEMEGNGDSTWKAVDAPCPTLIEGLPQDLEIKDISCGSHHTSILMEDGSVYAMGIANDTTKPIGSRPVQIIPTGLIDAPVQQFSSHFDRTTIVAGKDDNQQVLEVQLWSDAALRESAVFEPGWVESLTENGSKVLNVQRGWLHTVVITSESESEKDTMTLTTEE